MIRRSSRSELEACNFKYEPHSTWCGYDGDWWVYEYGGRIVAHLCMRTVRNRKVVGGLYTHPDFRRRGISCLLVDFVVNTVYANEDVYVHALISSKHVFENCGFVQYRETFYPYGTQYLMKKEARNAGGKKA